MSTSSNSSSPWPMFHGAPSHSGYANVIGPQTAILKWKVFVGQVSPGPPPNSIAVSPQGILYVGGPSAIFALDVSGKMLWYKNYTNVQGPAVASDGTIHFAAKTSIVAIDPQGNQKWQYTTGNSTIFGPTIGPDGTVYQGSWDHYFYAINPDGTLKWKFQTNGCVSYPSSVGPDGTIYLGGGDAHCGPDPNAYAFTANGQLKWEYNTHQLRVGSPAVANDGTVFFPASPELLAMNPSGNVLWTFGAPPAPPSSSIGIVSPAIGPDGTIYVGSFTGTLFAIDSTTHQAKWNYTTGVDPAKPGFYGLPSFPIVDKEGDTYFGAVDHKMYAFDSQGRVLWTYTTGGEIAEAAPAMDSNGNLYFCSEDGYLYAIAGPPQITTTTTTTSASSSTTSTSSTSTTSASTSTSTTTATSSATTTSVSTISTTTTPVPEFPLSPIFTFSAVLFAVAVFFVWRERRPQRSRGFT